MDRAGLGWDIYGASCNASLPVSASNCAFGKFNADGTLAAAGVASSSQVRPIPNTVPQRYTIGDVYKSLPTKLPSQLEVAYGEFYSGSPFLGNLGSTPVGSSSLANVSGGFFHMFHSHAEREIVNGGVFPGGMMTFMVIEPTGVAIDTDQP